VSESLPRLVDAEALGPDLPDDVLLVDVADPARFARAHLPGARLADPRWLVDGRPPAPGRLPEPNRLRDALRAIGYRPDRHVLVYDDEGGGWAGRLAWTLDIIGHDRWSYLDGGLPAWLAGGLPVQQGLPTGDQGADADVPDALTLRRSPVAELDDVRAAMADPAQVIWDVRSAEEYRGEKSGSPRAGHIPTAVNLDWQALKDPARHFRLRRDLPALLADHGIDAGRRVITHCQTHHRSGLSYLVGRLLDFRDIRAYHGAWAEWGSRADTPIVTGADPGSADDGTTA
jgi:thiosulfate/3-mercaptopyruvate sulfurtransferase